MSPARRSSLRRGAGVLIVASASAVPLPGNGRHLASGDGVDRCPHSSTRCPVTAPYECLEGLAIGGCKAEPWAEFESCTSSCLHRSEEDDGAATGQQAAIQQSAAGQQEAAGQQAGAGQETAAGQEAGQQAAPSPTVDPTGLRTCGAEAGSRCSRDEPVQCLAGEAFGECGRGPFSADVCDEQCEHPSSEYLTRLHSTNLSRWRDYWGGANEPSPASSDFPEVVIITVSTSKTDQFEFNVTMDAFDQVTKHGSGSIFVLDGVKPDEWPHGGGHKDDAFAWVESLGKLNDNPPEKMGLAVTSPEECHPDVLGGFLCPGIKDLHHIGAGLSHLSAWLIARHRNASHLLLLESDANLNDAHWLPKLPEDFEALITGTVALAPSGWDVINFQHDRRSDHGAVTLEEWRSEAVPVGNISTEKSLGYTMFKWPADPSGLYNIAGAAFNLYSGGFLQRLPAFLGEHGLDMLDAWVDVHCRLGDLQCYTVECAVEPAGNRLCSKDSARELPAPFPDGLRERIFGAPTAG